MVFCSFRTNEFNLQTTKIWTSLVQWISAITKFFALLDLPTPAQVTWFFSFLPALWIDSQSHFFQGEGEGITLIENEIQYMYYLLSKLNGKVMGILELRSVTLNTEPYFRQKLLKNNTLFVAHTNRYSSYIGVSPSRGVIFPPACGISRVGQLRFFSHWRVSYIVYITHRLNHLLIKNQSFDWLIN